MTSEIVKALEQAKDEDAVRWFEQQSRKDKRRRLRAAGIQKGFRGKGGT